MKMNKLLLFLTSFCFFLFSCSNPVPKPHGYFRIDLPHQHEYVKFTGSPGFSFDLSVHANIESMIDTANGKWFDIHYPAFNAQIWASYFSIKPSQLNAFLEGNHRHVYAHVMKANAITEELFSNPEKRVYGVLYHLKGNVATPLQFMLTDSSSHFFRASLLFNAVPNQDSITPVLNYITEDVIQLIESFKW